ncbi:MAG: hypothetical protein V3T17_16165 [Pseudomonadales bacterium]
MKVTENNGFWKGENVFFVAALALYASCWFLPIIDGHVGFDGAREAHVAFWKLLKGEYTVDSPTKIFEIIFISIGWLANELFVLGIVLLRMRPVFAVRCIAFSLGIMISWQVAMDEFPLLIGYWFWVVSGAIMLYFVANTLSHESGRAIKAIIVEPVTLSLLLFPVANVAVGVITGMKL